MLKQWLKEQWYDIKYAHKSLWASIVCIAFAASALVWIYQDHRYGGDLKLREDYIKALTAQNNQLRALVIKYVPKQALQGTSSGDSLIDQAQDKIYELQNNVNNLQTGVQGQVQQMDDNVNNAANNVNNSLVKMQINNDTRYNKAKQRAFEATH